MNKSKGTALVTGGAIRIGRSIAVRLSELGFHIALHYRTSDTEARKTAEIIKKNKVRCQLFSCDLSDADDTFALMGRVKQWSSGLNLLINSSSVFERSSLRDWQPDHYERQWNINFKSAFILTSEFAKHCKKGQVVNILDTNIVKDKTSHFIYLLTKKSLFEFTKMAAVELAPNIRVNAVAPGPILPPLGESPAYLKKRAQNVPLREIGNPSQIADCVAFLVNSPYITGQVIFNDGGEHLN